MATKDINFWNDIGSNWLKIKTLYDQWSVPIKNVEDFYRTWEL